MTLYACFLPANASPQQQHQTAHDLLRFCLREVCGITDYTLEKGRYGKPFLPDYPDIHFNLSHCQALVVCGIGTAPLGVDAEALRQLRPAVVRRVCHETEVLALNQLPEGQPRDLAFTRLWTLKESFIKAVGKGLSYPMRTVAFDLNAMPGGIVSNVTGAVFFQYVIDGQYIISACSSDAEDTCTLNICTAGQVSS